MDEMMSVVPVVEESSGLVKDVSEEEVVLEGLVVDGKPNGGLKGKPPEHAERERRHESAVRKTIFFFICPCLSIGTGFAC